MPEPTTSSLSWDWKSRPSLEDLERALAPFGLYVYQNPLWDGSTVFSYIVSNQALDPEQVQQVAEKDWEE